MDEGKGATTPVREEVAIRIGAERARSLAIEAGFADAGVVALPFRGEREAGERFAAWIAAGRAGEMRYLERRDEAGRLLREQVRIPFPWARSAVVCFASYKTGLPGSLEEHASETGWIARYAGTSRKNERGERVPSDYHKVLKRRLERLEALLRERHGTFEARGFVDTGPVLERSLAVAAGLGWIGKNTCLIHPRLGSFGFLAVLLTSLESSRQACQPTNSSAMRHDCSAEGPLRIADRCGTCTRCLEACPTGALTAAHEMDARRCIAYLTIERKGTLEERWMAQTGRQVFGCDICQDVCPWNRRAEMAADVDLEPRAELVNPGLGELGALSEDEFEKKFNGSPVRRAGYFGLLRNVAVAMGNNGDEGFCSQLRDWAESDDEGLRRAAEWALGRLRSRGKFPQKK